MEYDINDDDEVFITEKLMGEIDNFKIYHAHIKDIE